MSFIFKIVLNHFTAKGIPIWAVDQVQVHLESQKSICCDLVKRWAAVKDPSIKFHDADNDPSIKFFIAISTTKDDSLTTRN